MASTLTSGPAIEAEGLSRTFTTRRATVEAVKAIDLTVDAGEVVGFLGPNGAGKTTTQRMLTTLLEPTAGEARVAGADLRAEPIEVRRRIGYVAQGGQSDVAAYAGEELIDQALLYGIDRATAERRGRELIATMDLEGTWERPIMELSGGQRRRLDIALGLVHEPGLLFLDEPTTGLDPQARANLWDHIRGLRDERGATVFLTTHYLEEADALCDRLLVIDHGEIVAEGTPEELKQRVAGDAVELSLAHADDGPAAVEALRRHTLDTPHVEGHHVRFGLRDAASQLPAALGALDGIAVTGLEVKRPSLDDVFLNVTGRALRDEVAA